MLLFFPRFVMLSFRRGVEIRGTKGWTRGTTRRYPITTKGGRGGKIYYSLSDTVANERIKVVPRGNPSTNLNLTRDRLAGHRVMDNTLSRGEKRILTEKMGGANSDSRKAVAFADGLGKESKNPFVPPDHCATW